MVTLTEEELRTMSPELIEKIKEHNRQEAMRRGMPPLDDDDRPWTEKDLEESLSRMAPVLEAYNDFQVIAGRLLTYLIDAPKAAQASEDAKGHRSSFGYSSQVSSGKYEIVKDIAASKVFTQNQAEAIITLSAISTRKLNELHGQFHDYNERRKAVHMKADMTTELDRALVETAYIYCMNDLAAIYEPTYTLYSIIGASVVEKENLPQYFYSTKSIMTDVVEMNYYFEWQGKVYSTHDAELTNYLVKGNAYDAISKVPRIYGDVHYTLAKVEEVLLEMSKIERHPNRALFLDDTGYVATNIHKVHRQTHDLWNKHNVCGWWKEVFLERIEAEKEEAEREAKEEHGELLYADTIDNGVIKEGAEQ